MTLRAVPDPEDAVTPETIAVDALEALHEGSVHGVVESLRPFVEAKFGMLRRELAEYIDIVRRGSA